MKFVFTLFLVAALIACRKAPNQQPVLEPIDYPAPPSTITYQGKEVYLSGVNLAWIDFARDFGNGIHEDQLREALEDLTAAGGNTLRWWVHTDGSMSPKWAEVDREQRVVGPGEHFVRDLRRALDIAAEYNVYVVPSLWSFDMLKCNDYRQPPNAANANLLRDDKVLQSYLENVLVPVVSELNSHPQLIAWELFNEPENMTEHWLPEQARGFHHWNEETQKSEYRECKKPFTGPFPTLNQLQRTQAKMAAAIHRTAQSNGEQALVTTGSKSLGKYGTDVRGGYNWYRDDRMIDAADGDRLATLDFYQPHYYNNENRYGAWSPFHHHVTYWKVDKPVVIGEFHAHELDVLGDPLKPGQLCARLKQLGYAGGWVWQWIDGKKARQNISACLKAVD